MPALLAALAVVVAAVGLAAVWTNDLRLLADLLRLAGSGGRPPPVGAQGPFSLAGPLLGEVAFVSQTLGERAEEVNRLRRAEESILERLPDPLIVLAPDRGVRRTQRSGAGGVRAGYRRGAAPPGIAGGDRSRAGGRRAWAAASGGNEHSGAGAARGARDRFGPGQCYRGRARRAGGAFGSHAGARGGAHAGGFRGEREP
ncbi:MAG: hypothetical protein WDN04_22620 [Rhodospirillales bacterium]